MNAAFIKGLIEQTESHHVGKRTISSSDLEFFGSQFLMQVEVSHSKQLSVHLRSLLTWSDSDLLIAVGMVVNLDELSHKSAGRVCRVYTCIQSLMSLIVA